MVEITWHITIVSCGIVQELKIWLAMYAAQHSFFLKEKHNVIIYYFDRCMNKNMLKSVIFSFFRSLDSNI